MIGLPFDGALAPGQLTPQCLLNHTAQGGTGIYRAMVSLRGEVVRQLNRGLRG
ncbi:MAG: hypothetical protein HQ453_07545 [Actinobacteria bacterium]|nr:hypothetical protein [Actinomycetota bacterium]